MSDSGSPRVTRLLPDAVHQAVKPGTAVVQLQTTHDRRGVLDGAWWPCSRDIAAELPALISALTEYLGPVTRVGLDAGAWDALPTRLVVDVGRAGQDRPVSRSSTDEPDSNHSASRPPRGGSGVRSEEG
jgi:hypothetical protein